MMLKQTRIERNNSYKTYKELSIQISLDGLSFCTRNSLADTIDEIKHFSFSNKYLNPETLLTEVKNIVINNSSLNRDFDKLIVIYANNLSTFVPEPLFNEEHLADYLKYNIKILANDFVTYDDVANTNIKNVYIPFVNINNFFLDWYGAFEYTHFSTVLLAAILNRPATNTEPSAYIHLLNEKEFQLIVTQQNKLLFYNSFAINSAVDFIYYLLFAFEQLELNTETIATYFIADIEKDNELFTIAYTYIRNVAILAPEININDISDITTRDLLKNFILLNALL